jgi:uncharacterized protein YkwD
VSTRKFSGWLLAGLIVAPVPAIAQDGQKTTGPDLRRVSERILAETNRFRADNKRAALKVNEDLAKTSRYFADFMARTDKYGHTADGNEPWERAKKNGYDYCLVLENIAYQFSSEDFATADLATRFVEAWKKSPGHRKNMLDPDVTETDVAVAHAEKSGRYYAVQMFGRPRSAAIVFKLTNSAGTTVTYTLDGKEYTVKPRFTITHEVCRPPELKLSKSNGETASEGEPFHPRDGDRLVIHKSPSGGLTLLRR